MYKTVVTRSIAAAHRNGPPGGRCDTMHGHTWEFTVVVEMPESRLDEYLWTVDFGAVKALIDRWDHQTLNETVTPFPSAENLARMLYGDVVELLAGRASAVSVKVQEAPGMWVEYDGPDR